MTWNNNPRNFTLELLSEADDFTKKITGEMLQQVVVQTPVDTGQARGNWRVSIGTIDTSTDSNLLDRSGSGSISVGLRTIQAGGGLGKVVHISNSLSYMEKLNNGWSMQAPKNFVQIAFRNVVNRYGNP